MAADLSDVVPEVFPLVECENTAEVEFSTWRIKDPYGAEGEERKAR